MALLERLLVALAQRHHRGHVDLVEGREHRGGALRLDQPPRDRRAPLRHADALFGALAGRAARRFGDRRRGARLGLARGVGRCRAASPFPAVRRRRCRPPPRRRAASRGRRRRCRARVLEIDVVLSSAALRAVGVDARLLGRCLRSGRCLRGRCAAAARSRPLRGAAVRCRRRTRRIVDHAEHLADLHVLAVLADRCASARRPAAPRPRGRSCRSRARPADRRPRRRPLPCAATSRRARRRSIRRLPARRCLTALICSRRDH